MMPGDMTDTTEQAVPVAQEISETLSARLRVSARHAIEGNWGRQTAERLYEAADAFDRLASLPCKSGEGAGREALDQAIALIQEAKGIAGDGAVTDHLDFAEHWLGKVEAAIEPILFRAALQGKVDGYTLPLSKEIARSVIGLPASSIERDILALTPDATQTREAEGEVVAWLYERKGCDPVVEKDAHRWTSANGWTETPLCRAALNARGGA